MTRADSCVAAIGFLLCSLLACSSDESDADGGSETTDGGGTAADEGGTTACESEPGTFAAAMDWSASANPGMNADFVPLHAAFMPPVAGAPNAARDPATARLFLMAGYGDQHLWDPATASFAFDPLPPTEMTSLLCAGHVITPYGDLFLAGGGGGGPDDAIASSFIYHRTTANAGQWERVADMNRTRWYPTLTQLLDGRVLAFGGAGTGGEIAEIYDPVLDTWTEIPQPTNTFTPPFYPLMFLLPDGNVFYAGAEDFDSNVDATNGRVLNMGVSPPAWTEENYPSSIAGGSAVMYAPGKIMKSGGSFLPSGRTEWIDLTGDYISEGIPWYGLPENVGDMQSPRHLHTLTLLPDGRVLATGGNWYGNWREGDATSNECDPAPLGDPINEMLCDDNLDCPTIPQSCVVGSTCGPYEVGPTCDPSDCPGTWCKPKSCSWTDMSCEDDTDCPASGFCLDVAAFDHDGDPETSRVRSCHPGKNECYATKTAEIWDPISKLWSPCPAVVHAEEDEARMYHSTALLLRDATVISMGGGNSGPLENQTTAQVYEPPYGAGTRPQVVSSSQAATYNTSIFVELQNPGTAEIDNVTLVRLGSVTHAFNMDQRFIDLGPGEPVGNGVWITMPSEPGEAPPGWYFLFALDDGRPSEEGLFIQLTDDGVVEWTCAVGSSFQVVERGCIPSSGPSCGSSWTTVALQAPIIAGTQRGWTVHTQPGAIANPSAPTTAERAAVLALCQQACQLEWQNEPGVVPACTASNAFLSPTPRAISSLPTLASISDEYENGAGIFPSTSLGCSLEATCCTSFDEAVCASVPERPTPSKKPLQRGQAYAATWKSSSSKLRLITNVGTWTASLVGTVGHSPCRDGNGAAPCAFYLGSLTANTTGGVTPTAQCSDGTTQAVPVTSVTMTLEQPAFGVARQGSTERGFPPGAFVMEVNATVGGQAYKRRVPTGKIIKGTESSSGVLQALTLDVDLLLPCNNGTTPVTARLDLVANSPTGSPPVATINVPSTVTCGTSVALTKTVSDPNNDIVSQRWLVDGTLLASTVSSLVFTGTHTLSLRVRDARGATTTAKKVISCS